MTKSGSSVLGLLGWAALMALTIPWAPSARAEDPAPSVPAAPAAPSVADRAAATVTGLRRERLLPIPAGVGIWSGSPPDPARLPDDARSLIAAGVSRDAVAVYLALASETVGDPARAIPLLELSLQLGYPRAAFLLARQLQGVDGQQERRLALLRHAMALGVNEGVLEGILMLQDRKDARLEPDRLQFLSKAYERMPEIEDAKPDTIFARIMTLRKGDAAAAELARGLGFDLSAAPLPTEAYCEQARADALTSFADPKIVNELERRALAQDIVAAGCLFDALDEVAADQLVPDASIRALAIERAVRGSPQWDDGTRPSWVLSDIYTQGRGGQPRPTEAAIWALDAARRGPSFRPDDKAQTSEDQATNALAILRATGQEHILALLDPIRNAVLPGKPLAPATGDPAKDPRAVIGVGFGRVSEDLAKALGWDKPRGVLVTRIAPDGPAKRAGVLPGDIVVGIEGKPVADRQGFLDALKDISPGQPVKMDFQRGQVVSIRSVTPVAPPSPGAAKPAEVAPPPAKTAAPSPPGGAPAPSKALSRSDAAGTAILNGVLATEELPIPVIFREGDGRTWASQQAPDAAFISAAQDGSGTSGFGKSMLFFLWAAKQISERKFDRALRYLEACANLRNFLCVESVGSVLSRLEERGQPLATSTAADWWQVAALAGMGSSAYFLADLDRKKLVFKTQGLTPWSGRDYFALAYAQSHPEALAVVRRAKEGEPRAAAYLAALSVDVATLPVRTTDLYDRLVSQAPPGAPSDDKSRNAEFDQLVDRAARGDWLGLVALADGSISLQPPMDPFEPSIREFIYTAAVNRGAPSALVAASRFVRSQTGQPAKLVLTPADAAIFAFTGWASVPKGDRSEAEFRKVLDDAVAAIPQKDGKALRAFFKSVAPAFEKRYP